MIRAFYIVAMGIWFFGCALSGSTDKARDQGAAGIIAAPPGVRFYQAGYLRAIVVGLDQDHLPQPYEVETLSGWITIKSCADAIAALGAPPERELLSTGFDAQGYIHFNGCIAGALSARVGPAERSHFSQESPLRDVVQRLNLLDVGSSLNPAHPERTQLRWFEIGQTERLDRAEFAFEPTAISVETEDWWYGIELIASGDWTGDGLEDVLVMFTEDSKVGTLLSYRPIVLEASSTEEPLRVRDGFDLLRALLRAEAAE